MHGNGSGPRAPHPGVGLARAAGVARRMLLLAALWLVLAGPGREALWVGAAVAPAACWLSFRLSPSGRPLRVGRLMALAPGFLWRSLLGGVDVAWRAFHPRLPIDPGWVEIAVALPEGGKAALGGELSLMPGTLVAGSDGERLHVHVLDRGQDVRRAVRLEEARLGRAIGGR